jgi:cysteine desulfurase family protein (TIGR01976 family)
MTRPARSVEAIRLHFPALNRKQDGTPVAYFDGPGGTQVPQQVVDAMSDYLLHHNSNTHWHYPTSLETDALISNARATLADFVNGRADEIVFGQNMTSLTFHLARGLGRAWGPGDEIVITELDHHANQAPWTRLALERGVTIRTAKVNADTGRTDWDDLQAALTPKTKLLAIGAASNALGSITDIAAATALAKQVGALVFIDAVHYAPHMLVDVQAIGCDFLACSAYKFYGPHIGILWGKHELLQSVDVPKLLPSPTTAPDRLETGTQSHESIVGAAAAVEFLAEVGGGETRRERLVNAFHALHERGEELVAQLWNGLGEIAGVTRYGPPPGTARTPTVSFTVKGKTSSEVAKALVADGLYVSNGDFYASTVVERLGKSADGLVRAGAACYTTPREIERLVAGVAKLVD